MRGKKQKDLCFDVWESPIWTTCYCGEYGFLVECYKCGNYYCKEHFGDGVICKQCQKEEEEDKNEK